MPTGRPHAVDPSGTPPESQGGSGGSKTMFVSLFRGGEEGGWPAGLRISRNSFEFRLVEFLGSPASQPNS